MKCVAVPCLCMLVEIEERINTLRSLKNDDEQLRDENGAGRGTVDEGGGDGDDHVLPERPDPEPA